MLIYNYKTFKYNNNDQYLVIQFQDVLSGLTLREVMTSLSGG